MKLNDLAELLGKSVQEVEAMLNKEEVIELKLTEKNTRQNDEKLDIMFHM